MNEQTTTQDTGPALGEAAWLKIVRQYVGSLRYGAVEIIVHDGQPIQIDKTERVRLVRPHSEHQPQS